MKIAIFGGTFNPIHFGHLFLAEEVRSSLGYNKILFIPNYIPALKKIQANITPEQRLQMLHIAVDSSEQFIVDDCEIKRAGVSYMIDTLEHIGYKYDLSEKPGLIIGDDLIKQLPSWKDVEKIFERAIIIVAHRKSKKNLPVNISQI